MGKTVTIKRRRHSTEPDTVVTLLRKSTGLPVDLTGATFPKFQMRLEGAAALKVDVAASIVSPATAGQLRQSWLAAHVDTSGCYALEFEVILASGKKVHIPEGDDALILIISDDLDDN